MLISDEEVDEWPAVLVTVVFVLYVRGIAKAEPAKAAMIILYENCMLLVTDEICASKLLSINVFDQAIDCNESKCWKANVLRKNERKIVSDCSAVVVGWFEWSSQRRSGD